jgi:hypothetical protein
LAPLLAPDDANLAQIGVALELITGTPVGHSAVWAVAWCLVIACGGYFWALARYNRNRVS